MHTKAFVVDNKVVFFGSLNFDPRSSYLNTENGVIIQSEVLAEEFTHTVKSALDRRTYEVFLDDNDQIRWRSNEGNKPVVLSKEPQTTWLERLLAGLGSLLPIRDEL